MTAAATKLPVERMAMTSRDPGEVQDLINRRYVDHRPRIVGDTRGFDFRSESAAAAGVTVDHVVWRACMAISADPFATVVILSVLDGRFDITAGDQHARLTRGESVLYPPYTALDVVMDRMTYQVTQLPMPAVAGVAGRVGIEPADFRFDAMMPLSAAANRQWLATVAYLTRLLGGAEPAGIPPLLLTAAVEAAAAAALSVFPNTTMTMDHRPGPGQVAPSAVRRAVACIDARAAEPLTLEEIAGAAGLGIRALQAAFRRHLDTTPLAYLRRVRLERAHRELQAATPAGESVAAIAHRWGFADLGRFAAQYRDAFGRLPSHTLRT